MPSSPSASPRFIEAGRSISAECGRSGRPPMEAGRSSSTRRSTESYQSAAAASQPSGRVSVSRGIDIVQPDAGWGLREENTSNYGGMACLAPLWHHYTITEWQFAGCEWWG